MHLKHMYCLIFMLQMFHVITCQDIFIQTTTAGNLKGKIVNDNGKSYSVYLGIPFAKPPLNNLRFKDPVPLDPRSTSTLVDASKGFSKTCIQLFYVAEKQSEDCLYLNVLSPKTQTSDNSKYPVMVWIHGGGFIVGSASDYPVEGALKNIVSRGVVFVSINYRLGTFGFFSTKSSAALGNYGMMDQVEALKWVQKNIEFFGGDPTKVTIFGESAGGASVSLLTISPLTKGLFNQAIIMSGSALSPWALVYDVNSEDPSGKLLESVGCRKNVTKKNENAKCPYNNVTLPNPTDNDVQRQQREVECLRSKFHEITSTKVLQYAAEMRPRIDGKFLPQSPEILIKSRSPYNVLIGVTHDEFATFEFIDFPSFGSELVLSKDAFDRDSFGISCTSFKFPSLVNFTAHGHYAKSLPSATATVPERQFWFDQDSKVHSALMFVVPVYQDAINALKTNSKVYLYSWDYRDASEMYNEKTDFYWKGPSHGSELFSLFDNDTLDFFQRNSNPSHRDKQHDKKAAEILGQLWTNFAKFGNPTPESSFDGVMWNAFTEKDSNYLSIEVPEVRMKNKFFEDDIDIWTNYIPQLEASVDC